MPIAVGNIIDDRYEIIRPIASGGFATVFEAYQKQFDRTVAIKVLDKYTLAEADALPRFEREAKAVSGLRHKNIVAVYGFGLWRESPYMVLEYVDGINLHQLIQKQGKLSPRHATALAMQVCEALEAAHAHGIIHRDLKPQNIMITHAAGGSEQVKIIDFGLAKLMPGYGIPAQKLTETGAAVGTCHYMPPEQCTGYDTDHRVDIYSLGCIFYEMLTGSPPFIADTNVAVMFMHLNNGAASTDDTNGKDADKRRAEAIVRKAMAKERDERYESASQFLSDLSALIKGNEPTYAQDAPKAKAKAHAGRESNRPSRKAATPALFVTMLLLVGAAALFAFSHTSRPPEPDGAPRLTSLDLYRRAYNDGHIWDSRNGDRKIIAREAVTRNTSDGRLDTLKLYDLYAIITAEDMAHEQWSDALRDNVAARAYLTRHDPASPNLFTCILTEADCLYHLHREEQAEKLVMEVIDAPAGKYRSSAAKHACFKLANFRLAHGKKEEAVQLLRKACEQDSDEEIMRAARLLLGNLLISLGRPQEAEPIIHDGLTWPGIPHKAGDFQEAMLRCYLAEGKYSEALTMRSNIDKSRIATPHPYNLCVQTITMYAGSRSYENTKFAVDTLIGMPAPVFDSAEWSQIDIKQCTKMLQAAGYGDLLKALEQRYPAWKAVT